VWAGAAVAASLFWKLYWLVVFGLGNLPLVTLNVREIELVQFVPGSRTDLNSLVQFKVPVEHVLIPKNDVEGSGPISTTLVDRSSQPWGLAFKDCHFLWPASSRNLRGRMDSRWVRGERCPTRHLVLGFPHCQPILPTELTGWTQARIQDGECENALSLRRGPWSADRQVGAHLGLADFPSCASGAPCPTSLILSRPNVALHLGALNVSRGSRLIKLGLRELESFVVRLGGRPGGEPSHDGYTSGNNQTGETVPADPALLLREYRRSFGGSSRAELRAEVPLYLFLGGGTVGLVCYGASLRRPLLRGLCWLAALALFGVSGLLIFGS